MEILTQVWETLLQASIFEKIGFVFGLLAVWYLIKESVLTWPAGIIYCLVSFYVYWNAKLYQDFLLTIFFLVMNIYGWYIWKNPPKHAEELPITNVKTKNMAIILLVSFVLIGIFGYSFNRFTDASLPYWDATTTVLSLSAMFMTAQKKIENWILWFVVDVVASSLYFYKGLYFYSVLYFVYLAMAVAGYINWRKLQSQQQPI